MDVSHLGSGWPMISPGRLHHGVCFVENRKEEGELISTRYLV